MKRLACDICGSSDIIKQDGAFVCQGCGVKYTVEEVRKMLSDGPVPTAGGFDPTENYYSLAKNALDAKNNAEAESYCNRILEINPANHKAWLIKGKSVGWQSTLTNQRLSETVAAFNNAYDNCPEEEKEALAADCIEEIESICKALISLRMDNFMIHPDEKALSDLLSDYGSVIKSATAFRVKAGIDPEKTENGLRGIANVIMDAVVGQFNAKIWKDYTGDNGKPNDYAFRRFIGEADVCIKALELAASVLGTDATGDIVLYAWRSLCYESMIKINTLVRDSCSWEISYSEWGGKRYVKNLTLNASAVALRNERNRKWTVEADRWRSLKSQIEKEVGDKHKIEAQARFDDYWEKHAEEKAALESLKKSLKEQIDALNTSMSEETDKIRGELYSVEGGSELAEIDAKINALTMKKDDLGVFKGKEKTALQEEIDLLTREKRAIQAKMDSRKKDILYKIESVEDKYRSKISDIQIEIDVIDDELTKER